MLNQCTLHFSDSFSPQNFVLLEVDKEMVDALSAGQSLTIRGRESDNVVLCTESATFRAKDVEISNSFLLVDGVLPAFGEHQKENEPIPRIVSIANHFLELAEEIIPSQSYRLRELLAQNEFDFYSEQSPSAGIKGIELFELLGELQMSEVQLKNELAKLPIVEREGFLFLLSDNCRKKFLDEVVELCDSPQPEDISVHSFTEDSLKCAISLQATEIDWFLHLFCNQNDDGITYSIREEAFLRERVEWLLKDNRSKQWRLDEFEQSIGNLLPNGFRFRMGHVDGLAFVADSLVYGKTIRALLPDDLPKDLNARLEHLFGLKPTWKRDELRPYVLDFCPNLAKMEELLMKHCKIVGAGSERAYIYRQL